MNSSNLYKNSIIFTIFLVSLLFGFVLNEDFAGGAKYDFGIHKETIRLLFFESNLFGLLNYGNDEIITNTHSPIFIIILKYILFFNEIFGRLIYLVISSFIVLFFFKSLKIKYKLDSIYLFILSNFFILSPYYRSYSIWPGDETLSLMFFCVSIFFYLKMIFSENKKNQIIYISLNVLFLAISSYLRPIYCIFSIFYFYSFFIERKFDLKLFIIFIIQNFVLAFPAFYYVFILEVNFFISSIKKFNFINSFALFYLTMFFYLLPFIYINIDKLLKFELNKTNIFFTLASTLAVLFFFDYKNNSGGGFFYKLSLLFFDSDILIYILFPFAFYLVNEILNIKNYKNLLLIILLIFFELDDYFFIESYDPLFYLLLFLVFKSIYIDGFFQNIKKGIIVLFLFQVSLITIKFLQQNYFQNI